MSGASSQPHQYFVACGGCQDSRYTSTMYVNPRLPTSSPYRCPNCTYAAAVKGVNCSRFYGVHGNLTSKLRVRAQPTTPTLTFYANPPGTSFLREREVTNKSFQKMRFDEYEELMDTTQRSRRRNLEITGIPVTEDENLCLILFLLATAIGVPFRNEVILSARRLRIPDTLRSEGAVIHPHIIVTFVNKPCKMVWSNACRGKRLTAADLTSTFPCTRVFVNDHLTWRNKMILRTARRHVRCGSLAFAWTVDCKILVKKTMGGPSIRVFSVVDVESLVRERVGLL